MYMQTVVVCFKVSSTCLNILRKSKIFHSWRSCFSRNISQLWRQLCNRL